MVFRIAAVSFLLSLVLYGCGQKVSTEATAGKTATSTSQATAPARKKLVVALQTYSYITDYDNNYLTKKLEEELGVDIEFHLLSASMAEANTQLSLMIASGKNLPDVIATGALSTEAILTYGSKGVFIPLQDMLKNPGIAPNFNAIASEEDKKAMITAGTSADGNMYALTQFDPSVWNMSPFRFFINQTWLDKLGLEMPTTTEEYYQVLKAFKTQDPNGNGKADEIPAYGISSGTYGENITIPLMNSFIYYPATKISTAVLSLDETTGKVIAPFATPQWRKGLEYMNKLCREGLLPEAIFTDDRTQFMAVLNNESANLVGSLSSGSLSRWNDYDNNKNGQEFEMLAPLEGPEGIAYNVFVQYKPESVWFITSACKDPELAMRLGDLFYNQEISRIARYGETDVDWTSQEDMLNNPIYSNAYIQAGLYDRPSLLILNDIWAQNNAKFWRNMNPRYASIDENNTEAYAIPYDGDVKSFKFRADNYEYNFPAHPKNLLPLLNYTADEAAEQSEIIVNVSTYISQSMAQFITGARPLTDREWNAYLKELDTMGLQVWLENSAAAYARTL